MLLYGRKISKRLFAAVCAILLLAGCFSPIGSARAAVAPDRVDLRFIFTTDLHGMLTTQNYETNREVYTGSLAKAYTLIKQAREEKEKNNSFTFDLGDAIFDYTTETIFEEEPTAVQPMYKAMAKVGYDAIVLGNHEFDYGLDYIMRQMTESGLSEKCVVSNVKHAKTKKNIFQENMLITRKVKTEKGKTATIKIGVVGETVPVLSKKREDYTGILTTEDIVENATEQAAKLKKQGADLVVVIAHSGFGDQNPDYMSKDAAYALTKIKDVDAVFAGHAHKQFPSSQPSMAAYYKYKGVDAKTGLVNGKSLVMANDKGQSIGVADMTLELNGKTKTIVKRSSEVRKVTAETAVDASINASFGKWKEYFEAAAANEVGYLEEGQELENYFGLVEDSNVMQLLNNSKMNYAMKALADNDTYSTYPIVAASRYNQYGQLTADEFIHINGELTESNLSMIASAKVYVFLYDVSGAQLKEWLEWAASAYETTSENAKWTEDTMKRIMGETGFKSLVSEEWLDSSGNFYIIDGISYTIDPSVKPRYNYEGKKINSTSRIVNMTYNGVPVTDTMRFVLATEPLTGTKIEALQGIENNYITKGINKNIDILMDYVRQLSAVGNIQAGKDNNWRLQFSPTYRFIVKASIEAGVDPALNRWYDSVIESGDQYVYYKGKGIDLSTDTDAPNLVLASGNERATNKNINIIARATDASSITKLTWAKGSYDKNTMQSIGTPISDYSFTVTENGIYTVYAEDQWGNGAVASINISNINTGILQIPTIKSYTNRMSTIHGTAEPNAKIYFETESGSVYEDTVEADGKFSFALPSQKSGTRLVTYVKDLAGRVSDKVTLIVKRTGANQPFAEEISNTQTEIRGKTNDRYTDIFITAGDKVFVNPGNVEGYQESDKYAPKKTIVKTEIKIDSEGNFTAYVPPINDETTVWVYGLDSASRTSKGFKRVVKYAGPNAPTLYQASSMDNTIYGKAQLKDDGGSYEAFVVVGNETFEAEMDEKGNYFVECGYQEPGTPISTYVKETKNGSVGISAEIYDEIKDPEDYVEKEYEPSIFIDEVTNKTDKITGRFDGAADKLLISVDGEIQTIEPDDDGAFTFWPGRLLKAGTKIIVMARMEPGRIVEAAATAVKVGLPYPPVILNKNIYDTTRKVRVATAERGRVEIRLNGRKYSSAKYSYDEEAKRYIFEVQIKTGEPGDMLYAYAYNSAGASKAVSMQIIKNPKVKEEKPQKDEKN